MIFIRNDFVEIKRMVHFMIKDNKQLLKVNDIKKDKL